MGHGLADPCLPGCMYGGRGPVQRCSKNGRYLYYSPMTARIRTLPLLLGCRDLVAFEKPLVKTSELRNAKTPTPDNRFSIDKMPRRSNVRIDKCGTRMTPVVADASMRRSVVSRVFLV